MAWAVALVDFIFGAAPPAKTSAPPSLSDPLNFQRMLRHEGQRFVELEYALGASQGPSTRSTHSAGKAESLFQGPGFQRSEEHTSELQSHSDLVCRLLLEKKKKKKKKNKLQNKREKKTIIDT